jgi:uncharacterized protein (TIGR00251 family)
MTLHLKVKPGSRVDQLSFDAAGTLTVKIKAPAQDGRANEYLIRYLSGLLGLSPSQVQLVSGFTNPHKKLLIDADEGTVRARLEEFR